MLPLADLGALVELPEVRGLFFVRPNSWYGIMVSIAPHLQVLFSLISLAFCLQFLQFHSP